MSDTIYNKTRRRKERQKKNRTKKNFKGGADLISPLGTKKEIQDKAMELKKKYSKEKYSEEKYPNKQVDIEQIQKLLNNLTPIKSNNNTYKKDIVKINELIKKIISPTPTPKPPSQPPTPTPKTTPLTTKTTTKTTPKTTPLTTKTKPPTKNDSTLIDLLENKIKTIIPYNKILITFIIIEFKKKLISLQKKYPNEYNYNKPYNEITEKDTQIFKIKTNIENLNDKLFFKFVQKNDSPIDQKNSRYYLILLEILIKLPQNIINNLFYSSKQNISQLPSYLPNNLPEDIKNYNKLFHLIESPKTIGNKINSKLTEIIETFTEYILKNWKIKYKDYQDFFSTFQNNSTNFDYLNFISDANTIQKYKNNNKNYLSEEYIKKIIPQEYIKKNMKKYLMIFNDIKPQISSIEEDEVKKLMSIIQEILSKASELEANRKSEAEKEAAVEEAAVEEAAVEEAAVEEAAVEEAAVEEAAVEEDAEEEDTEEAKRKETEEIKNLISTIQEILSKAEVIKENNDEESSYEDSVTSSLTYSSSDNDFFHEEDEAKKLISTIQEILTKTEQSIPVTIEEGVEILPRLNKDNPAFDVDGDSTETINENTINKATNNILEDSGDNIIITTTETGINPDDTSNTNKETSPSYLNIDSKTNKIIKSNTAKNNSKIES
jgi:hypothetical protein